MIMTFHFFVNVTCQLFQTIHTSKVARLRRQIGEGGQNSFLLEMEAVSTIMEVLRKPSSLVFILSDDGDIK